MQQKYEYEFVRLGEGWNWIKQDAEDNYQDFPL